MKNDELTLHDMDRLEDLTDWAAVDAMTDEEITAAALSDPDAQPLTEEELRGMRRLSELPGETVFEKLQALKAVRLKEIEQKRMDMMEAQTETQHS